MKVNLLGEVYGLKDKKPVEQLKTKELLMLSINTSITVGTVQKISVPAGVRGQEIEVTLNIPSVILEKDKVGIARNIEGHWRLIGWGEVVGGRE